MKRKVIPAIIMLLGGAVRSIMAVIKGEEFSTSYAFSLLMVLIVFYIIGLVVKFILDKTVPPVVEEDGIEVGENEEQAGGELENIQEDSSNIEDKE